MTSLGHKFTVNFGRRVTSSGHLVAGLIVPAAVGARRGGVLISLLVLPLLTPVLILGASAVDLALAGLNAGPLLMLLGAMLLIAVVLCPWAAAAGLRLTIE